MQDISILHLEREHHHLIAFSRLLDVPSLASLKTKPTTFHAQCLS